MEAVKNPGYMDCCDIKKIDIDLRQNSLDIDFYFRDQVFKSAKYKNLLYLSFKPDFFGTFPFTVTGFGCKEINAYAEIENEQRLYSLDSKLLQEPVPPFYRFVFRSPDLELIIISNDYEEKNFTVPGQEEYYKGIFKSDN